MNILLAASEAYPLIKTGGLGDVVHGLSEALLNMGDDVRLVLPAYGDALAVSYSIDEVVHFDVPGSNQITHYARVLNARTDHYSGMLYFMDVPSLFDRTGNPYVQADGSGWHDNAERFTVFSRVVAELAAYFAETGWQPDVVHCHDWQTGLVPAFLSDMEISVRTVFTIHNLAYDGYFSRHDFNELGLPEKWWSPQYVEFHGGFSMLKAGMVFADHVTTVSPTYAREIRTPKFGYRYAGVLRHLGNNLSGILNGIDIGVWNPRTDRHIRQNYSTNYRHNAARLANKNQLLALANLPESDVPLLGFIGRLVEQKGVDLIAEILPRLFAETNAMVIMLGSGEKAIQSQLQALAELYAERLHVYIGYSEAVAHQIEAGCDLFLMPSRFEPCGLNQMYSLRYGTPPLVNYTGGLADTVVDASPETINNGTATGFVMPSLGADALLATIKRALSVFKQPRVWRRIRRTAMEQQFGWGTSAGQYRELYQTRQQI